MCPKLDMTLKSSPRKRSMVLAFAGLSTITKFFCIYCLFWVQKYADSVDTPNKSALFSVPTHLIIRERAAGVAKHRRREQKRPEFGLSLFSKNKVRPTFGVRHQLQETLSQKCTGLPLLRPTRTRSARVRRFSFFAFTSSPYDCKNL